MNNVVYHCKALLFQYILYQCHYIARSQVRGYIIVKYHLFLYFLKIRHTFFWKASLDLSSVRQSFAVGNRGNQALL